DHSANHARGDRQPDREARYCAEMFFRVTQLVLVIRPHKALVSESRRTIASGMNELCRWHEKYVPALRFDPPAKIHVLVPCRKELFVEAFDFFIGVSADHERGGCGLINT